MHRILTFLAIITMCWGAPQYFGRSADGRIVNGTNAKEGDYPYQISLRYGVTHICGGSIINAQYILTAAHCIDGIPASYLEILAGTIQVSATNTIRKVQQVIPHSGYEVSNYYIHDIAILKLAEPLPLGDLIQAVKLPQKLQDTAAGTSAILTGWGYPYSDGSVMQILQFVEVFTVSDAECLEIHSTQGMYPHESNLCAGYPGGGKGQCTGDSGGPLVANGVQVGVVSWSQKPCAAAPYPGVFTQVSYYIDWINEQIQN